MDHIVDMARDRIERGSKSFAGAARIFPEATRASAYMLYAWCRHCDDEIDGQVLGYGRAAPSTATPEQRLERLRDKTIQALRGKAEEPIFIALQRVVAEHKIPERHPLELLDGMEMDVKGRTYHSIDDTLSYSYHVAGVVGVMMAMVMNVRDRPTLERASDLGIAFQLTNIARDVVPDAEVGRAYLPSEWLGAAGLTTQDLADRSKRLEVFDVTTRLLDVAERYYQSAGAGVAHLPFRSAWAITAARRVYRDIGTLLRARGAQAWDGRTSTSTTRKISNVAIAGLEAGTAFSIGKWSEPPRRDGLWTPPSLGKT
jgi:15-cis-phytoene synthase